MPRSAATDPSAGPRRPLNGVVLPESPPPRLRRLRYWLGGSLVLYAVALQLAAALGNATWEWPVHASIGWHPGAALIDATLRAIPVGYFVAFGVRRRRAVAIAVLAAVVVEAVLQELAATRGVAVNIAAMASAGIGACAGAIGFLVVSARLRARAANDAVLLAPDLPLVGGAYLVTPLLWLTANGAARDGSAAGPWGMLLLGLFGSSLLASARANRGRAGGGPLVHAIVSALWCAIGIGPLITVAPDQSLAIVAAVAGFAAVHQPLLGMRGRERRIEAEALRRALPFLALYGALATLRPMAAMHAGVRGDWLGWVAIDAAIAPIGWAGQLALFTLLGYVLAELRGRQEQSLSGAWRAIARVVVPIAAAAAVVRVLPEHSLDAVGMRALLTVVVGTAASSFAARLGATLYALQRWHARAHASRDRGLQREPASSRAAPATRTSMATPGRRWASRAPKPIEIG